MDKIISKNAFNDAFLSYLGIIKSLLVIQNMNVYAGSVRSHTVLEEDEMVPNGQNMLLFKYMCIWPSFHRLMHLVCHNESPGSKMDQGSDTRLRNTMLENKMHVADGKKKKKKIQGDSKKCCSR